MPPSGQSVYSRLAYDTSVDCGLGVMYAAQEWAQHMFSVSLGGQAGPGAGDRKCGTWFKRGAEKQQTGKRYVSPLS